MGRIGTPSGLRYSAFPPISPAEQARSSRHLTLIFGPKPRGSSPEAVSSSGVTKLRDLFTPGPGPYLPRGVGDVTESQDRTGHGF